MEPDPDAPALTLVQALWLAVLLMALVVVLVRFAV